MKRIDVLNRISWYEDNICSKCELKEKMHHQKIAAHCRTSCETGKEIMKLGNKLLKVPLRRVHANDVKDEIIKMLEDKKDVREIKEELNVDQASLNKIVKDWQNAKRGTIAYGGKKKIIEEMLINGDDLDDICQTAGVKLAYIYQVRKKMVDEGRLADATTKGKKQELIIDYYNKGYEPKEITEKLNSSRPYVNQVINDYRKSKGLLSMSQDRRERVKKLLLQGKSTAYIRKETSCGWGLIDSVRKELKHG